MNVQRSETSRSGGWWMGDGDGGWGMVMGDGGWVDGAGVSHSCVAVR